MTGVRVLVGTQKGGFVLTAEGGDRTGASRALCSAAGRSIT